MGLMVQKTLENGMLARENVSNVMQTIKKLPIVLVIIVLIWIAIMTKEKMRPVPGLPIINVNLLVGLPPNATKKAREILVGQGRNAALIVYVRSLDVILVAFLTIMVNVIQLINVNIAINQILVPGQTFPQERFVLPQA